MPFFQRQKRLAVSAIRESVKSRGADATAQMVVGQIERGEIKPENFSLRDCWEAFVGPVGETLTHARSVRGGGYVQRHSQEAVQSNAFTYVTGNIAMQAIMDAYNLQASVLDQLITPYSSRFRMEPLVGFQAAGEIADVPEGQEYAMSTMAEKAVMNPEPKKRGGGMEVTEEAIYHDQTGQLLSRASDLGRAMYYDRESRGMRRVQDLTGYEVYYPIVAGTPTQTALFRNAAGAGAAWYNKSINKVTGTNTLADWTDIDNAQALLAAMKDEKDREIVATATTLLVPYAIFATALRILNAIEIRATTATAVNTTIGGNVVNDIVGGQLRCMWSPFMNNAADWYYGDPKRQFKERIIIQPQVVSLPPDPRKDIVAGWVAKYKTQVECTDDKFWIMSAG